MGKRHPVNTYKSVSQKINLGLGRGEGLSYKPFITGHEFASKGKFVRLNGLTVPREYCFVSELEADAFVIYDIMPDVSDILEQYYLSLAETIEIADLLHIPHPYSQKYFHPVTTDLLVCKGGTWIARAVKTSRALEDPRTIAKLEIERVYFSRRQIDWKIITEKQLNRDLIKNIRWLWYDGDFDITFLEPCLLKEIESCLLDLYENDPLPFPCLLDQVSERFSLPQEKILVIFKLLVRQERIRLDLEKPLNPWDPRYPIERRIPDERYLSYC